jgi:2,5-diamino-6-(ribosylamino)-4(3H)-pyrimidinone 5'-phosphate reductase
MLVGSNTAKTGIEIFCEEIPSEEESDFVKGEAEKG